MRFVSVAVPVPFLDRLTYRVPDHLDLPPVGARVRVPVGSRTLTGCVVTYDADAQAPDTIKDVVEVIDREPFLPTGVVDLCAWVAEYYLAGIGDAIAVAMPPGARARASSFKTRQVATITPHGLSWGQSSSPVPSPTPSLTPKQRAALDILAAAGVGLPAGELRDRGVTRDVLARLVARGLVTLRSEAEDRDPFERAAMPDLVLDPTRVLTPEQQTDSINSPRSRCARVSHPSCTA